MSQVGPDASSRQRAKRASHAELAKRGSVLGRYSGIDVGKGGVETIIYRLTKAIRDCVKKGAAPAKSVEGASA